MANALYDFGRENFLGGDIDWDANTIKVVVVDSADYTRNLTTDNALDDIAAGGRVATSSALSTKTKTAGVADADDVTLSTVTGDQFEYIIGYKDSGVESTSLLIFCIDTATGLPFTPSGSNIIIQWDSGSNKIFKL